MGDHFGAFSFVDRITRLRGGQMRAAALRCRAHFAAFLRAWSPKRSVSWLPGWRWLISISAAPGRRAGGRAALRRSVPPGQTLDLAVDIDDCDRRGDAYSGWAYVEGVKVIDLEHCLGPMLPVEDFDAPDAMRERFELLCGSGAPTGSSMVCPADSTSRRVRGKTLARDAAVPQEAAFFADHFPRRPVFPGTMLFDIQIRLAIELARFDRRLDRTCASVATLR